MEGIDKHYFSSLLQSNYTYKEISELLQQQFPGQRGFSVRSIERYCSKNNLSSRIDGSNVENMVAEAVNEVEIINWFFLHTMMNIINGCYNIVVLQYLS